ncbi:MAG: PAS domain-containing protein, partial [Smithella sp.]
MRLLPVEKRTLTKAYIEAHLRGANKKVKKEMLNVYKTMEPAVKETVTLRGGGAAGRKTAESFKQSEYEIKTALDASGFGIWDWNLVNKNLIMSEKCRQIFGYDPDLQVSYDSFLNTIHSDDREQVEKAIADALMSGETCDVEMRILWPDNTIHWAASKGKGVYQDGKPVRMIGVANDITEKRRIEHDLMMGEKLKSVGRLAGGIAHDFNNLLAIIQGNIELTILKINGEEKDIIHNNLNAAQLAAKQAAELTKRLITFASGGMPFKRKCDIREMLVDAIQSCFINESIKKIYLIDNNLWPVNIDESQIRQVFRNIAINAMEAM